MKKVLFVIRSLGGGGAERTLSNIVTHFPPDWDIDILVNHENLVQYPYKGNILSLDLVSDKRTSPLFITKEIWIKTRYLKRLKKEKHYDVVLSFLDTSNIANILSGNKYSKNVISVHVNMFAKEAKLLYKVGAFFLFKLIYNRADRIITVSKEIERELLLRNPKLATITKTIVNGYDCREIMECASEEPENNIDINDAKLVVTVGRLNEQKGQWHLIRAFSRVVEQVPDAYLLILGTGELLQYLQQIISALHLEKNVLLAGYCENPFWYEAKAQMFVMPSMYEGYPNALAEAICCGVPCIATDFHSGAREILAADLEDVKAKVDSIVELEYGILTPLCSGKRYHGCEALEPAEECLAEAILMLLTDHEKREHYVQQCIKRREQLGIDSVIREWVGVFEELSSTNIDGDRI